MCVYGILANDWEKFHPTQFVNIWEFEEYPRLVFFGNGKASDIPEYLGDEDMENFVLEPISETGEEIPLVDAINFGSK